MKEKESTLVEENESTWDRKSHSITTTLVVSLMTSKVRRFLKVPKKRPKGNSHPLNLLKGYDFPAEHWEHIRTTNPIESTFATVRLRTAKTRGCVSRAGMLAMAFKLTKTAEQNWRTLKGHARLGQVIEGVRFKDGLQEVTSGEEAQRIAA